MRINERKIKICYQISNNIHFQTPFVIVKMQGYSANLQTLVAKWVGGPEEGSHCFKKSLPELLGQF